MKRSKHFKKKILVTDEKSSPEARAARLRKVRNMANFTREDICSNGLININTYKGWEIARYGGLPPDGAKKIVERIAEEGVICTPEWLIYEIGVGPYVLADFKNAQKDHALKNKTTSIDCEPNLIFNEILLFRKQFHDVIDYEIIDDGLRPYFSEGDFVAGIKHYKNAINSLHNKDCIVQLTTGATIARRLKHCNKQNTFTLCCTNLNTCVPTPTLYDAEIVSAAPIIRHYKQFKNMIIQPDD